MAYRRYDVMIGGVSMGWAAATDDLSATEMRDALIEFEYFPATISVYREAIGNQWYDQLALAPLALT